MKLIIDIPKEEYEEIINSEDCGLHRLTRVISNGIPIPDNATNGLQKTCDDAISRQAVLDVVEREQFKGDAISEIEKLPSVRPQKQTGHWRAIYQGDEIINYRCSECEFGNTFNKSTYRMNYCPNCGADMRGEKNG